MSQSNAGRQSIQLLQQQRRLLQMEYEAEREEFRAQMRVQGLRRKVKRGDCWWPVSAGRSYYNSLNQPCVELLRQADEDVEHNFEYGRPVAFFLARPDALDGQVTYLSFNATVSYAESGRMVVVLSDMGQAARLQSADDGQLGVQLSFDETSYRLMFQAIDYVLAARDNRVAQLRDLFSSGVRCGRFSFMPQRFPWLNASQEHAVNEILLCKDVAIVHGPPGTGKTTTLVEAICEVLQRESQVLVCAQSNMAVDWISERLVDRQVAVLRLGNPTRVNDKMLSFTYERRFESHPDYADLWAVRKAIRQLRGQRSKSEAWHQKMDRLKSRATELELRINASLFAQTRVIACTLTGAANRLLDGQKFGTLFIDEAAQALEPACWIALRRAHRLVLAGDHQQLPPTVKSLEALRGGLGRTLMERLVEQHPEAVTLLRMQYRMNEQIMQFSNRWFYGGMIESAPEIRHRGIFDLDTPIVWLDTQGLDAHEEFVGDSFGRVNRREAEFTLQALERYFTKIGKQRVLDERIDVGIISPYRAQVQLLRGMVRRSEFFKPYRSLISINTVDGFQGQERDVIVISLVRANARGQIGFLSDLRRMNVAITRARMKLIILGDAATLTRHEFYRQLYEQTLIQTP